MRYTLIHGNVALDGIPMFGMIRALGGDGAPTQAAINAVTDKVVHALNLMDLVDAVLTDEQLDHVHADGSTIRQRLIAATQS